MDGSLIVRKWKILGVAGLAGVAATGVVIVRAERRRQALSPEDVRVRLHQRYEAVEPGAAMPAASSGAAASGRSAPRRSLWRRFRRTP
jgi:hypothetical protein